MSDGRPAREMDDEPTAPATPGSNQVTVRDEPRRAIERWLVARGVPQLVEGYSSEQRVDTRALPLIGAWLVVANLVLWVVRPDIYFIGQSLSDLRIRGSTEGSLAVALVAMLIALVAAGLLIGAFLRFREHPPFRSDVRLDVLDVVVVSLVPGIVAAAITGDPGAVPAVAAFVMSGIGIIYALVALGVPELTGWGLRHLRENLPHLAMVVARTLPLLLILVVFLLFAAELWQAAQTLGIGDLVAVSVLLAVVGSVFVVTEARQQIRAIEQHGDDGRTDALLTGTPAAGPTARGVVAASPQRSLGRAELLNLVVLVLVIQLLQALFIALVVAVFLVVLGVLVAPVTVQDAWAGAPVRGLVSFVLLDVPRTLSMELVIAAGLLGAICGTYFMGFALTDATYRAEFDARVVAEIRRIMAVRSVYVAMSDDSDSE